MMCSRYEFIHTMARKSVNPLEITGFLHNLVMKFDLSLISVTTVDKQSLFKLITHKQLYVFMSLKYVNPWI